MGKALYRKYRSKKLSEVIGQEHITTTLEKALKSGNISHAYLFTGPRGVGKTSIARIVAHEINKIPYEDDSQHIDIIEIDAASNRRIDEIRDLREKVYTAPAMAPYKVYIIDEVHMLTKEAFNALLKTLEEPPAHVVFILATTDLHKLPETIVSRTQRFSFKPVSREQVAAHLKTIAEAEGIKADGDALELLAEHGEGSFRDSISMLDQTSGHTKHLTLKEVRDMLGIPPVESLKALLNTLSAGSSVELMGELTSLYNAGYPAQLIAKELGKLLRLALQEGVGTLSHEDTLVLLEQLLAVPTSMQPDRLLEIILLKNLKQVSEVNVQVSPVKVTAPTQEAEVQQVKAEIVIEKQPEPIKNEVEVIEQEPIPEKKKPAKLAQVDSTDVWPSLLGELKKNNNTLYGVVRMAEPLFLEDGTLELSFAFAFHQKRINDTANKQIISRILKDLTGKAMTIECIYKKDAKPAPQTAAKHVPQAQAVKKDESIDTISNIFGGGELLES